MGVGAGLYMYVVVVQKFTFAISSPDEFLLPCSVQKVTYLRGGGAIYPGRVDDLFMLKHCKPSVNPLRLVGVIVTDKSTVCGSNDMDLHRPGVCAL